ncbi:hypothetical protein [Hyalangium rubrum]|uniref:Fucolectin tachylectin-4 pentraxin-1 domain-containing protein n=1 Tax=Hyalangium rubrum TaxID=3103134 RepID=A0ABU5HGT4_9BACT|nr:hypothetical protein [Hyalangium sp. s54d21]MDY7232673.1 hypothetical protein [Hyalangium sp. s54d21]
MKWKNVRGIGKALLSLPLMGLMACGQGLPEEAAARSAAPEPSAGPSQGAGLLARLAAASDCSINPFGARLMLGGEFEPFVAFRYPREPVNHMADTTPYVTMLDRVVSSPSNEYLTEQWMYSDASNGRYYTQAHDATAADLNGDGRDELVQAFRDADQRIQILSMSNAGTGTPSVSTWTTLPGTQIFRDIRWMATTAGNLDRSSNLDEELSFGFVRPNGLFDIYMLDGNSAGGIAQAAGQFQGWWKPSLSEASRVNVKYLGVASGDLDGDSYNDEIVVAFLDAEQMVQLIVLKYQQGYTNENKALNYKEIASARFMPNAPLTGDLRVAVGNIDGGFRDEIVVAAGVVDADVRMNTQLQLRTFKLAFDTTGAVIGLTPYSAWDQHFNFDSLALAVGDTDRDGLDEIALAFRGYESTLSSGSRTVTVGYGFNALTLDAEYNTLLIHNHLFDTADYRTGTEFRNLSLAVGDLDKDGYQDLVASFKDNQNYLQTVRLADMDSPGSGLRLRSTRRDGSRKWPSDIKVVLGDWTNDSIRGYYEPVTGTPLKCQVVVDPQISSAIFVPPFWKNINTQGLSGSIGKSSTVTASEQTTVTASSSHSISSYVGVGAGIEGVALEASVRVTAGREWGRSQSSGHGGSDFTTISEGWSHSADFAVIEEHYSKCYTYQLRQGTQPIDGWSRVCEPLEVDQDATQLNIWDVQFSPLNNTNTHQWVPIARDWSNLALLRFPYAAQSSTCGKGPDKAVDGRIQLDNNASSYATTCTSSAPWWQVDLGSSQAVGKVRVWNRPCDAKSNEPCPVGLKDFYVFVSDTDFRTISSDPNVLKNDPRVHASFHAGVAIPGMTFLTLAQGQPITGRYVRIQMAGTGEFSLTEVQVFGTNHVEPDRYPRAVRNPTRNPDTFEVEIYDSVSNKYQWVPMRGRLLWNGAADNVLGTQIVGPGGAIINWSLTNGGSEFLTEAQSFSNTWRAGISMEASVGVAIKVQMGAGYEYSSGMTEEESRTVSYENAFELAGSVGGFPSMVGGQIVLWPDQCRYRLHPYYYETTERSKDGFEHRFLVVDYMVPSFLDRTADLQPCRDGQYSLP